MLQKLEQAGFEYAPADRLRALRLLDRFAVEHLGDSESLKYRLAPILARNKNQQERFYKIYMAWWEESKATAPPPPVVKTAKSLPKWILWLVLVVLLIPLAILLVKALQKEAPKEEFTLLMEGTPQMDSTLRFGLAEESDSSLQFIWERYDKESERVEERIVGESIYTWEIDTLLESPQKVISLYLIDATQDTSEYFYDVRVQCAAPPNNFAILAPRQAKPDEDIIFALNRPLAADENIIWTLAGETLGNEATLMHRFDQQGLYNIQAKVSKDAIGVCERTQFLQIAVGDTQAPLAARKELQLDEVVPSMYFTIAAWALLGLLLLPLLYLWWRWWKTMRKTPEEAPKTAEEQAIEALNQLFHAPDKAPYYIPYRDRNSFVRTDASLYRFANLLRQRQEGFRQKIDLPATIRKTIEGGGFPAVAFQTDSMPSEYLFLVDDLAEHSHQKQLFDYLIRFLRDKDIHLQVFHYEKNFNRFWNEEFPQGINLARIHRLHPHHRLLVMGNGHELLKPFGGELLTQPQLREQLQAWQERLLLTPLPVASWTFQEQAIYDELMAVFPADLEGFQTAMGYLDLEEETAADYLPHFSKWEKQLAKSHPQPGINGRKWSRFSTYQDYFTNYPQVYTWFCALAVHPQPTWELTLAIGRALEEQESLLTYDHLLMLSHIPWLQGQSISSRLREQLLAEVPLETQTLARQVVEGELEAVKADVAGSHANFELQNELAVQAFALDPEKEENRARIQYLLDQGWLNKKQRYTLEQAIGQHLTDGNPAAMTKGSSALETPSLEEYLQQQETLPSRAEGEKDRVFIPVLSRFLSAAIPTLFWGLLLLAMLLLNGSTTLYRVITGEAPEAHLPDEREMHSNFFAQERQISNEAATLNNEGVQLWREVESAMDSIAVETSRWEDYGYQLFPKMQESLDKFQAAKDLQSDYELANQNYHQVHFNMGHIYYQEYFDRYQQDSLALQSIQAFFQVATQSDSLFFDAFHAIGLIDFYQRDSTQANLILESILGRDSSFFDTLRTRPHLEDLLRKNILQDVQNNFIETQNMRYQVLLDNLFSEIDAELDKQKSNSSRQNNSKYELSPQLIGQIADISERFLPYRVLKGGVLSSQEYSPEKGQLLLKLVSSNLDDKTLSKIYQYTSFTNSYLNGAKFNRAFLSGIDLRNSYLKDAAIINGTAEQANFSGSNMNGATLTGKMNFSKFSNVNLKKSSIYGIDLNQSEFKNSNLDQSSLEHIDFDESDLTNAIISNCRLDAITFTSTELVNTNFKGSTIDAPGFNNATNFRNVSFENAECIYFFLDTQSMLGVNFKGASIFGSTFQNVKNLTIDQVNSMKAIRQSNLPQYIDQSKIESSIFDVVFTEQLDSNLIPEMVAIKGDTFTMGCTDEQGEDCEEDEKPAHQVRLNDFYIGKYEVTNQQYVDFLNDYGVIKVKEGIYKDEILIYENSWGIAKQDGIWRPSRGYEMYPVIAVTWYGANEYAKWLSKETKELYRLPTEAEWEYAARGGQKSLNYRYAGSNKIEEVGWWEGNSNERTYEVGLKKGNELDIYDMSGNVWEWCEGKYKENSYEIISSEKESESDLSGNSSIARILRGGSWSYSESNCRVSNRNRLNPSEWNSNIGFRVVRDVSE